jgi:hypothetical protein
MHVSSILLLFRITVTVSAERFNRESFSTPTKADKIARYLPGSMDRPALPAGIKKAEFLPDI